MVDILKNFQSQNSPGETPSPETKPALRTMKTDVEEFFKTTKPSLVQIIGMREDKGGGARPETSRFKLIYLWGGVILTVAAIAISGFFYLQSGLKEEEAPEKPATPPSFFATETSRTITVEPEERSLFLRLMGDSSREVEREGTIKKVLIKIRQGDTEAFAELPDIFDFYHFSPPKNLLSLIDSAPMTFFYYSRDGSRFGLAVKIKSLDRVWAEMFSWEPSLLTDFRPLFFDEEPQIAIAPFEDRTYRNIDWRYLKLSTAEDLGIGYTVFPAQNILVMATSKEAMETVINRLFDAK